MRIASLLLSCFIGLATVAPASAQSEVAVAPSKGDPRVYGIYPIAYKELIQRWLETKLADPNSAVIEWLGEPKPGEYKTKQRERFVGYVVDFKVNARNQFGAYTGKQRYRVVLKNGEILWGGHPRY